MDDSFDQGLKEILGILSVNLSKGEKVYMVGGMVRDILLSQPIHDFDLVCAGDVRRFAIKVANSLDAAFFMLNDRFLTARVINRKKDGYWSNIDIIQMRGSNIEEDLALRDITINAIAIDIENPRKLIDPLSGALHLRQKKLMACSSTAYSDDPIRILRSIRQSISFNLRIEPQTQATIKQAVPLLPDVSPERRRDELFRNLDIDNPVLSINLLDHFGIMELLFPEIFLLKKTPVTHFETSESVWEYRLKAIKKALMLEHLLVGNFPGDDSAELRGGQAVLKLGRFRAELQGYFNDRIHPDRSLRSLLIFILLIQSSMHIFKDDIDSISHALKNSVVFENHAKRFVLTNKEMTFLLKIAENCDLIHQLARKKGDLSGGEVYQYFHCMGSAGVLLCFVTLAETLASPDLVFPETQYLNELQICRTLMTGTFHKNEVWIKPAQWLSGHDLNKILLPQDRVQMGNWIEKIRFASANGEIKNKQEAIQYMKNNYVPSADDN
jgi:poly(A) polymerase